MPKNKSVNKFKLYLCLATAFFFSLFGLLDRKDYENYKFNIKLLSGTLVLALIMFNVGMVSAVGSIIDCTADPSIVACWHLNNNSVIGENDTYIVDSSVYKYTNGTVYTAVYTNNSSPFNDGSYYFNNATDYIKVLDTNKINITSNSITISFWVNFSTYSGSATKRILYTNGGYDIFYLNNKVNYQLRNTTSSYQLSAVSTHSLNRWDYYTFVFNSTKSMIYINGVLDSSVNYGGNLNATNSLNIGGRAGTTAQTIHGYLDEILIYNKSLTSTQVMNSYINYLYPNVDIFEFYNCSNNLNLVFCSHINNLSSLNENYNSETFIYDNSGNYNFGDSDDATYYNNGSNFNDGYFKFNKDATMYIPYSQSLNFTKNFTIAFWIKTEQTENQDIIEQWDTGKRSWGIQTSGDNLYVSVSNDGTNINRSKSGSISINDNAWHHVIVTFKDSDIIGYVDGTQDFTVTYTTPLFDSNANIKVSYSGLSGQSLNASFDELLIFNKSFDSGNVKELYAFYNPLLICNKSNLSIGCIMLENTNLTLIRDTYSFNTTNNGIINIASNTIIDCNGSTIVGNNSGNAFYSTSTNSFTLKNCIINNYNNAIDFNNGDSIIIDNITINNIVNEGLDINTLTNSKINKITGNNMTYVINVYAGSNDQISNSTFHNTSTWAFYSTYALGLSLLNNVFNGKGIYQGYNNNTYVYNNSFLLKQTGFTNSITRTNGYIFKDNYILGSLNCSHNNNYVLSYFSINVTFDGNNFINNSINTSCGTVYPLLISGYSEAGINYTNQNITIKNNLFDKNDIAIRVMVVNGLYVFNNTFNNSNTGRDGYGLAMDSQYNFSRVKNVMIYDNKIYRAGINGFAFQGTDNISIFNNYIDLLNDSQLVYDTGLRTGREVRCAIHYPEIYKTWTGDGTESNWDNITKITTYRSEDVNNYNNSFSSNVQCYYRFQGTLNYNYSLNSTYPNWAIKHWTPTYLVDYDLFVLNNNYNSMTTKKNYTIETVILTDLLGTGYKNDYIVKYKFNKNFRYYIYDYNRHDALTNLLSYAPETLQVNLYNLSNSIIYYNNGTAIINYSGDINITLGKNNYTYVYPDYVINENKTIPENDPINITSTVTSASSKVYHISSLINNQISVPGNFSTNCNNIYKVIVKPKTGTAYYADYTCTDGRLIIPQVNLTYSTTSNEVQIMYNVTEVNRIQNTSTFETAYETFALNLTYPSTEYTYNNAIFYINNTGYLATKYGEGDNAKFVLAMDMPLITTPLNNVSTYWNITFTDAVGTYVYTTNKTNITINHVNLSLCNAALTTTFVNYTFKDESSQAYINATFDSASFNYYLGTGTVYRSYGFTNSTANYNYPLCATPTTRTIYIDPVITYGNTPDYDTRSYNPSAIAYTSTTTEQVLYLTLLGQSVAFTVTNSIGSVLDGVEIVCRRDYGGNWTEVGSLTTGSSGVASFFLNYYIQHQCTFTKSGYTTYTWTDYPSSTSYTVSLDSSQTYSGGQQPSGGSTKYLINPTIVINPAVSTLNNNTYYNFTLKLNNGTYTVSSFGFVLTNSTNILTSISKSADGGTVGVYYNTANNDYIRMKYYWIVAGNYTNGSVSWPVMHIYNVTGNYTLKTFTEDLKNYLNTDKGIFGLSTKTNSGWFSLSLIIYIIIFITIGVMSFKFGITSPGTISWMVFALVYFFDITLGLLPQFWGYHLPVLFTGLAAIILSIKEWLS